ncbi:hypothetical protein [Marinifilum sp. D714]|uniref:hypothetical protein n=1 Tax=Marinifilum sp. D714 TaxID=2937523 RepID=UPI0027CB80D2|nr:hypothetical protein [Marinifilum sp. D714]MDQ2177854.1 hypothetical protein [Marinifilum sp. D714]
MKQTALYLLLLFVSNACSNNKTQQQTNVTKLKFVQLLPQQNDTTFFELDKNTIISKKVPMNINTHKTSFQSTSYWKLISQDSMYTFELMDIRYIIPGPFLNFVFDTKKDSVQLIQKVSENAGRIRFGGKTVARQEKALHHLKRIKGLTFAIIKTDSCYFQSEFKLPLARIAVDNEYNPVPEIKNHLNPEDLISIFDKMLLRPKEPFVLDSLYKLPHGTFMAKKFSDISLNYTFQDPKGFIQLKNVFNADHKLIHSRFDHKSSFSKEIKTKMGTIKSNKRVNAFIKFKQNSENNFSLE